MRRLTRHVLPPQQINRMIQAVATLPLSSRHRVSQILFHDSQPYVAVQSHDRSIEVFRIRTEDEARKKQARRRKRAKEKEEKSKPKEKDLVDKADDDEIGAGEVGLVDLFTPYLVIRASGKVRSFDFSTKDAAGHKATAQVSCLLRRDRHSLTQCPDPFSTCVECVRSL